MDSAIVVGAGVFGSSLAWVLARAGVAVTLIDQFEPGDPRATSGGETRLLRCSHGADPHYTQSARRARALWRELEAESGERVYDETGMAWFAHREDGWEGASERTLHAARIPAQRLDPDAAAALYPSFDGSDLEFVLLEPEAGVLRAALATRTLAAQAVAGGAHLIRARARPAGGAVELDDGRRLEGGAVVWCCGAWLAALFPGLVSLRVTRQDLFFLDGGPAWAAAGVPAWVDYDLAMYGTPDVDALGVKAAPDAEGPELAPDAELPAADAVNERVARDYMRRRFPALTDAPLKGSVTCRYELSPDSNFIAAPHPADENVWIVGGGSGHGFKHGPALAEMVLAALRGGDPLPDRFRLGERSAGRSLRTAGSNT